MGLTKVSGEVIQSTINVGVVTASSFVGNLTGNATGLSGTPNITVGAITASSAVISGNISVAGTVTYEDTTNVDSIGVITARSGIRVTSGSVGIGTNNPAEQLELFAGSERLMIGANSPSTYSRVAARNVTNTGYRGLQIDGSDLLINSNTSGNVFIGSGGGSVGVGTNNNPSAKLTVVSGSGTVATDILSVAAGGIGNGTFPKMIFETIGNNNVLGRIGVFDAGATSSYAGSIVFETNTGGGATRSTVEQMRINYNGNIGIGTVSPSSMLHLLQSSGNAKITIQRSNAAANTDDYGSILWRSSAANNNGSIGVARESAENNGYMYFSTGSGGTLTERVRINSSGHTLPGADNTYDLGASGTRWRNIYTADLQMSNEGSSNDVDGTWGKYTIQEGENDLFLINRRTGKRYKFLLEEVK